MKKLFSTRALSWMLLGLSIYGIWGIPDTHIYNYYSSEVLKFKINYVLFTAMGSFSCFMLFAVWLVPVLLAKKLRRHYWALILRTVIALTGVFLFIFSCWRYWRHNS